MVLSFTNRFFLKQLYTSGHFGLRCYFLINLKMPTPVIRHCNFYLNFWAHVHHRLRSEIMDYIPRIVVL